MKYCRTKQKPTWSGNDEHKAHHMECYATTQCFSQHSWHCGQWVCEARQEGLNFEMYSKSLSAQPTNFVNITRVVHGTYSSVPFSSHTNLCLSHLIPWDVSHEIPIGMAFPWTTLGVSMGHIYLSHSHPIAIYACPIPWDVSHRNDIPMDKPEYHIYYSFRDQI